MNTTYKAHLSRMRHGFLVAALSAVFVAMTPGTGQAQGTETYTYPGTRSDTEFTIGNINDQAVAITALFYDGTTGESTAHAIVLNPGNQTRFTPADIGLDTFTGSTVINADLPIATTATSFEGADSFAHWSPVDSAVELVMPLAGMGSGFTSVSIFNPGDEEASARVILVGHDGESVTFNDRTIEPKRTVSVNVGGGVIPQGANPAYIVIRTSNFFLGGRPVSAAAFVRNFNPPDEASVIRGDVAYVAGRPVLPEPSAAELPLFRQGGGYMSIVQVINNSTGAQSITLTARDLNGQTITGGNNPAVLNLEGRAAHSESVEDLFDISVVQLQRGSIQVQGSARLSAAVAIGPSAQSAIAIVPAETALVQDFAWQTRQVGRQFSWLLSMQNPSAQAANLDLTFVLDDATVVSTINLTLPANTQLVSTLAEIFPEAQGNGFVLVHSDTPLRVTGLENKSNDRASALRRALPASPNFMSGPPTELFAVGTVRSNGIGLPGVTITLTGTQAGTTLTDAAGTYIFNDLPTGSYTLTGQAIGYTISPSQLNFSISSASSRDNDFTADLITPVITGLTPSAAPAGSADIQVSISGGPFISGSVALLGTTQLATTFVTSQLLQATVPASLMQTAQQYNFAVRNVGVAGNSVDSAPVPFTVGNPPPTLLTLSNLPDPLVAGSNGFTMTLSGSGFLPGAMVFLDGVGRTAAFISDTELQANITTAELSVGGFLPVFVLNPGPAVPSNSLDLVVLNPPPVITAISPATNQVFLDPNAPPLPLTVTGTGFQDGATVIIDSNPVTTQFVNSTTVTGFIPGNLMGVSGVHDVQVSNPAPSVGPSFAFPLTLTNPVPTLTSVSGTLIYDPGQAGQEQPAPIILSGGDFAETSSVWVRVVCGTNLFTKLPNLTPPSGGTLPPQYDTRRLGPGTMTATVNLECSGNYEFQVRSPQPGGGVSPTVTVAVP